MKADFKGTKGVQDRTLPLNPSVKAPPMPDEDRIRRDLLKPNDHGRTMTPSRHSRKGR